MCKAPKTVLFTSALVFAFPAFAQDQDAATENDIVVFGSGLAEPEGDAAYANRKIERERLDTAPSGRLENVLAETAGVQQFRRSDSRSANPSAQGITLRSIGGTATSRALVLLDAIPVADPFFGSIPFNALAPERIGAVRITRGGGTGGYGAGALTGTIAMESRVPGSQTRYEARAVRGSNDASELFTSVEGGLGAGSVALSARWDRGDGFFTAPKATRGPNDVRARYNNGSLGLRAVVPAGKIGELQARVLAFRDDRTLRFDGADSRYEGVDGSMRLVSRGAWQVDASGYLQLRNFANVVVSSNIFRPVLDQRKTPSTGLGGKIELRPPTASDLDFRIGSDIRLNRGELFENSLNGFTGAVRSSRRAGGDTLSAGLFGEADWSSGRLTLTGGLRVDRYTIRNGFFTESSPAGAVLTDNRFADRNDWLTSARGGVAYNISEGIVVRTAAYTGFRLPTLNELYRPFTIFPVVTRANATLRPETLDGVEAGIEWRRGDAIRLSVTAYANRLNDAVANVTIGPNLRERRNLDAVIAKGIEIDGELRTGPWSLNASYAFSDAKVRASGLAIVLDGRSPAQSPRHAATARIAWDGTANGTPVRAALSGRYIGRQFEDDLGANALSAALTVDGYADWDIAPSLTLIARMENMFDARVTTRKTATIEEVGVPRTIWFGLRFRHR